MTTALRRVPAGLLVVAVVDASDHLMEGRPRQVHDSKRVRSGLKPDRQLVMRGHRIALEVAISQF